MTAPCSELAAFDIAPGAGSAPMVVADCLIRPISMMLDEKAGTLYVTEYGGRLVAIPIH